MNTYLAVLLGYSVLQIGLGLWLARRTRSASEFFVAGRRLGPGLVFATMLAANIGAGSTVGAAGLGYRDGAAAWWWVGSAAIGSLVLAFWLGPTLRREAERHGLSTVGDYLEHRYGPSVRVASSTLIALGSISILSGQLIALAWLLRVVADVPKPLGCLVGGVVVTSYFATGGLLTSVRLNVLQLAVKLAGLGLALPFALAAVGGLSGLRATTLADPGYWDPWRHGGSGWPFVFLLGPAFFVSPGLIQKMFGARDDRAARLGAGANAMALFVYAGVPVLFGMAARAVFPDLASPELALPTLLVRAVPTAVGALGLAAVFSAEVSAADAVLFMLSTSLTQDVYRRLFDPAAPDGRLLLAARAIAAVCGALAVLVAIVLPDVIGALAIFYTLLTATLVVPLLGGLWSARAGTREALAAMGAGTAATLAAHLTAAHLPRTLTASMLGIVAAGLAFLLALALRRPRHSAPS